jgi:hypothetical protein
MYKLVVITRYVDDYYDPPQVDVDRETLDTYRTRELAEQAMAHFAGRYAARGKTLEVIPCSGKKSKRRK